MIHLLHTVILKILYQSVTFTSLYYYKKYLECVSFIGRHDSKILHQSYISISYHKESITNMINLLHTVISKILHCSLLFTSLSYYKKYTEYDLFISHCDTIRYQKYSISLSSLLHFLTQIYTTSRTNLRDWIKKSC